MKAGAFADYAATSGRRTYDLWAMDDASPPTAAELGISDAQYERIVHDLQRRHGAGGPTAPQRDGGKRSISQPVHFAVFGLIVMMVVLISRGVGTGHDEPTYAFMSTRDGVQPVTYSSCAPVQVAVYPAGGPSDAEELVREAVAQVRAASGLDIVVLGSFGGHAPNWNFEAAPITLVDPISVSWQDGDAIARMTEHVVGLGGSPITTSPYGTRYRVAGTIALSRDFYKELDERGEHDLALAVLLHEFGHVLGLAHVDSPGELMYDGNNGRTSFGPGDLKGLRLLGQGPCI